MTGVEAPLQALRAARLNADTPEHVREWAEAGGLRLIDEGERVGIFQHSPAEAARVLESRALSFTWDLDQETWAAHVQPAICMQAHADREGARVGHGTTHIDLWPQQLSGDQGATPSMEMSPAPVVALMRPSPSPLCRPFTDTLPDDVLVATV